MSKFEAEADPRRGAAVARLGRGEPEVRLRLGRVRREEAKVEHEAS